ncbi:hypothetical protein PG997_006903 [Apiospora hydei]|uniref:Mid2 domain-containing protein n=1 Tax=Apiospora hydei TaxID=1337664 RepID=A0ABR1WQ78_9PEZI
MSLTIHTVNPEGSVTIDPANFDGLDVFGKELYLSLTWVDNASQPFKEGKSFTTPFVIYRTPSEVDSTLAAKLASYNDTPYRYEGYGEDQPTASIFNTAITMTTGPFSTGNPSSAATTRESSGAPSLAAAGLSGGGGGGLNPGAIAGIVVGSVIGALLIIGALAYFLCFRRRAGGKQQRRHIHGDVGYASDSGAAAAMMMREKEMPGVNHSTPQSAYADDGGRLNDRGGIGQDNDSISYSLNTPVYPEERGMAAVGTGTQQQRQSRDNSLHRNEYNRPQSYAADSAIGVAVSGGAVPNTTTERERNGSVGGAVVGRASHQTSRPGSEVRSPSRYAHLIEEGMTEDEIRRLEDEERQLDAAIEDAGRHGRPK